MASIQMDLREIKDIPVAELDAVDRAIRARCDHHKSRTVAYLLYVIFAKLAGGAKIKEIKSIICSMGGVDTTLHLVHGSYYLTLAYSESLNDSWQSVEVTGFEKSLSLPPGIYFTWDMHLIGSGFMSIAIDGVDEQTADSIIELFMKCFETVEPKGARERRYVEELERRAAAAKEQGKDQTERKPERKTPATPLEGLLMVFDAKRDPYMEWHDGPNLHEVDAAFKAIREADLAEMSSIVAGRLGKGYSPYLGRAAELLNTDVCRKALEDLLAVEKNSDPAMKIARNLLSMGKNDKAMETLGMIIGNTGLHWGTRTDALVNLQMAMDSGGGKRPVSDFIPPALEVIIFKAIEDDDYLVRNHAAATLLKAAGATASLYDNEELFRYICGKHANEGKNDDADRQGFGRAALMLKRMLKKTS